LSSVYVTFRSTTINCQKMAWIESLSRVNRHQQCASVTLGRWGWYLRGEYERRHC
jgi:hypothetical protein